VESVNSELRNLGGDGLASESRIRLVREQLERILASAGFQSAARRTRLLRYLVEQTLENRDDSLKESVIAVDVFERAPNYDPKVDSVVRVEIGRLRSRLVEYYAQAGADAPVRIEIPKGGYRPVFLFRDSEPAYRDIFETPRTPERRPRPHWIRIAACAAALAVCAIIWLARRASDAPVTLAVLPFLNFTGDARNDYLCDGVSEELTDTLAQSAVLRVVSRTSAFQYKGKSADAREVGQKLGAGALLEGSVARRGEGLHVVAQLIRAGNGYHLWSQSYDAREAQLPAIEAEIGRAVQQRLAPAKAGSPGIENERAAKNPEAHDLYLRAAYEFNRRTAESIQRALELAQQAAREDPSYAQPYVLMAASESQLSTLLAEPPQVAAERARRDITQALALDPGNEGAHAQKAMLAYTDEWDWPQAERDFRRALAAGSHSSAENLYGWCLITRGRFDESRRHLQIAAELDPLSLGPQLNQVEELFAERRYAAAKEKDAQVLKIAPENLVALQMASSIAFWQNDCGAASASSGKLLKLYHGSGYARLATLGAEAICGHRKEALAHLDELSRGDPPGYLSPYSLAAVFAIRRDADRAFAFLEKSAEMREPALLMLKVDRPFDTLRGDARLVALERRLGLAAN
jgi:TolB-like protein